ncbi:nickel pincer cofactor biosynthesis protein LarC [Haloarcula litorea]|uniref:nickel pincer cofactor biosynthesis protein LarC n=1 Tax=Haloarcula litorea TaxID=3032579 RepID=UPI0023E7A5DF|nr:nickel pincer cofactor biosynthesis protein LarC [Halomicroarcula sp. GDY20]
MRTLAFDGRMGAAGDMVLGALLAAGADRDALAPVEDALDVEYAVASVDRSGIDATRVEVLLTDDHGAGSDGDDGHSHDHGHDNGAHTRAEGHGPHRSYAEVVDIVEGMGLPEPVEDDALAIFELLGEAEAAVHGTDLDDTHFHEVGADDAIADVVGAALLLADLGVERVVTTPLSAGGGTVEMSHGTYPVPTPAVVELAERADWALAGGPVDAELLTPTGAAVLAHVAEGVADLPSMTVDAAGYGAGGREFDERPNVLRATVGETEGRLRRDDITVLETNLDDASPELLGDLQRSLSAVGALDVSVLPTTMKKSRPGHLVKVICKPEDAQRVARRLAEETGTLGVREHGAGHRWVADREFETVALSIDGEQYEVGVKIASDADGDVYDVSAEFDDAAAVADATGLPVRAVIRRAERTVRD